MYEFSLGTRTAADGAAPAVSPADASQRARAVYERGVAAVRHSVDMWVKYCEFLVQTAHAPLEDCRSCGFCCLYVYLIGGSNAGIVRCG